MIIFLIIIIFLFYKVMTELEWAIINDVTEPEINGSNIKITIVTNNNDNFSLYIFEDKEWKESLSKLVETISPIVKEIRCEIIN